jgi:hypothetical protein
LIGDKQGIIYAANRLALNPLLEARALIDVAVNGGSDDNTQALDENFRAFLAQDPGDWDHKIFWGRAADAGTIAHEMVDCFIHKRPFDPESKRDIRLVRIAGPAYEAFRLWADQSRLEVGETEKALISEKYQFGGTRDAMSISGKRAVVDWKTSKAIYPEYLLQLAAYGILDEEAGNTIDGGYHLVRFSKQEKPTDPVMFSHHHWSHLDGPREAFIMARKLYGLMGEIEKLAK